jgi:hypothetical protein
MHLKCSARRHYSQQSVQYRTVRSSKRQLALFVATYDECQSPQLEFLLPFDTMHGLLILTSRTRSAVLDYLQLETWCKYNLKRHDCRDPALIDETLNDEARSKRASDRLRLKSVDKLY